MREYNHNGTNYRIGNMVPKKAFHVTRKLAPLVAGITGMATMQDQLIEALADPTPLGKVERVFHIMQPLITTLSSAKEEDLDYVLDTCLAEVYQIDGKTATRVYNPGANAMQVALDMPTMLVLTGISILENCGSFFRVPGLTSE
jgi:hypothetical protein